MRTRAALPVLAAVLAMQPLPARGAGDVSQIQHVIVLMQENRSFDHYMGKLSSEGQPDAEPEPAGAANPDPTHPGGPPIVPFHQTRYCEVDDLDHSWNATHIALDGGRMDGFTTINAVPEDPTGSRAMGYYDEQDLPFYYALYRTFATSDRYFASMLGPTFPNRFYLLAGTSFGHIQNDIPVTGGFTQRTVFNLLDEANPPISWKIYTDQFAFGSFFQYVSQHSAGHIGTIAKFYADSRAGTLPQVAFVDPIFLGSPNVENDEHPPANIQVGENFAAGIVNAVLQGSSWSSSVMFLTYDEHGGYFDHVAPPSAPVPDDIPPMLGPGDVQAAFDHYGVRVPVVVVSPYARRSYVSHVVRDHTSILRFIETRFGLPPLTMRDAAADPMLEMFDFSAPSFQDPPSLPDAPIDPAHATECDPRVPPATPTPSPTATPSAGPTSSPAPAPTPTPAPAASPTPTASATTSPTPTPTARVLGTQVTQLPATGSDTVANMALAFLLCAAGSILLGRRGGVRS